MSGIFILIDYMYGGGVILVGKLVSKNVDVSIYLFCSVCVNAF